MDGVPNLKGYKNTRRQRKLSSAQKIIDHLQQNEIEVDAIGLASKSNGQFVRWACDTINRAREMLGAEWVVKDSIPTHLRWNGKEINRSTVLGLSIYASMLPIIGLRAEILAQGDPNTLFKLCLDALPINSALGMKLMEAMRHESEIAQMWKENMERGVNYEVGTLDKWQDANGKWHPGKNHPNSILVDWLAVSCLAKVDPNQLQTEGNYTDSEIETIRSIWDATYRPSSTSILDLDDESLHRRIKEREEKKHIKKLSKRAPASRPVLQVD